MARKNVNKIWLLFVTISEAPIMSDLFFEPPMGRGWPKFISRDTRQPRLMPAFQKPLSERKNLSIGKKFQNLIRLIKKLKKEKYEIVALEQNKKSTFALIFSNRRGNVALILGNEVRGLSAAVLRKCDKIIEIPMRGEKESLNVSVAFGIAVVFNNQPAIIEKIVWKNSLNGGSKNLSGYFCLFTRFRNSAENSCGIFSARQKIILTPPLTSGGGCEGCTANCSRILTQKVITIVSKVPGKNFDIQTSCYSRRKRKSCPGEWGIF